MRHEHRCHLCGSGDCCNCDDETRQRVCSCCESRMSECDHGLTFDLEEAQQILGDWRPSSSFEFVMGNPRHAEVRRRFPRLEGQCPKRCGFVGIAYASADHFVSGDW